MVCTAFFFIIYIYLPCDTFINNIGDFDFALQDFIFGKVQEFLKMTVLFSAVVSLLNNSANRIVTSAITGFAMCVYVQYMFMNKNLNLLDGEVLNWDEHLIFAVFTIIVWSIILGLCIFAGIENNRIYNLLKVRLPLMLTLLQVLSLSLMIVFSNGKIFKSEVDYLNGDEQYKVASEENVIVFILDALDNSYFQEILNKEPDLFDGFEDFTLYTNTCSVFDSTPTSLTQMFTGMDFAVELPGNEWYEKAWNGEKANEFFQRFHNEGYTVNGYNIELDSVTRCKGKFDNYFSSEDGKSLDRIVNKKGILQDFNQLSLYRALPFAFKRYIEIDKVNFNENIVYKNSAHYENDEFDNHLSLSLGENSSKYFIVEHLHGTHLPCSDVMAETKYLLEIMRKYINQLKELGVYYNSSILILSDHGAHNDLIPETANTPVFMIKNKNTHHEKMLLSAAPVYHEDIQATLLDCAGLYKASEDEEMFGRTVFDINENEQRSRTWYDRRFDSNYDSVGRLDSMTWAWGGCNVYYAYTYTGDTEVLNEMVSSGNVSNIYQMTDNKG